MGVEDVEEWAAMLERGTEVGGDRECEGVGVAADIRGLTGGGPMEPLARKGFAVEGVPMRPVLVDGVLLADPLMRTLFPRVIGRVEEGGSDSRPTLTTSLLPSDKRDDGRELMDGVVKADDDSRR